MTSSARFKDQIKPMDKASEAFFGLKPVAFRYKKEIDATGTSQFGLVAEEVEKVNRDLAVRDKEGKPYTVRYDAVNAMLLNEFLKRASQGRGTGKNNSRVKIWDDRPRSNRERAVNANPESEHTARRSESVPWWT